LINFQNDLITVDRKQEGDTFTFDDTHGNCSPDSTFMRVEENDPTPLCIGKKRLLENYGTDQSFV